MTSRIRPTLHVLRLKQVDILRQLGIEELLLRKSGHNYAIINSGWIKKTIVVGFSGKIPELVNVDLVKTDDVRVIRRYTGGGTVIVDENSVFSSLIINTDDVHIKPYPREIMQWSVDKLYGPLFQNHAPNQKFLLRENDYTFDDKKIAGNAQTITKGRWVHHTSFLWKFSPENMQYLQLPAKRPVYRHNRDHTDFLTTLDVAFQSKDQFEDAICAQLQEVFDVVLLSEADINQVLASAEASVTPKDDIYRSYLETI